jgi:Family of unknown function (DUF5694)
MTIVKPTTIFAALAAAFAFAFALSASAEDAPVQVMIVGTFHMGNPGRDLHNAHVDDVLLPKYQAQIAAVTDALAHFHPSVVAVEDDPDSTRDRYRQYVAGSLPPSRNEVVQLGYRLAKTANLQTVYGVDVEGDFPFDAVAAYAGAHGQGDILAKAGAEIETFVKRESEMISSEGAGPTLRYLNDPALIAHGNDFYRLTLRIGSGKEQPGADLLAAWYRRNFLICANIIQLAKPGDRIVVFYGSGHSFLLRQCIQESPGFKLVEPNDYLP